MYFESACICVSSCTELVLGGIEVDVRWKELVDVRTKGIVCFDAIRCALRMFCCVVLRVDLIDVGILESKESFQ